MTKEKDKLFLIPFAGGNGYSLRFFTDYLKDQFELVFLELPGRGRRLDESLLTNLDCVISDYMSQILMHIVFESDIYIYGHSMGAILALRLCEKLESKKNTFVKKNFVSGCSRLYPNDQKIYKLDEKSFKKELVKLGGMPKEILDNNSFFEFYDPIIRADFEVIQSKPFFYEGFKINTPIYSMMGSKEEGTPQIENWKGLTSSSFEFKIFEGNHFFIQNESEAVSEIISSK